MRRLALLVLLLVIVLIVLLLFWRHCGPSPGALGCTSPCTAAGQCTLIMPLPYTAEQAVLSATSSLVLGAGSTVGASNGVPGAVANLGVAPTTIGDHATLGGIVSKTSVALGAGAQVKGPLTTSGTVLNPAGAVVQGKVTTNASIAADQHVMTTVTFPATAPAVTVASGATRILAPGSYGDVRVSAGGTLSLSTGTYRMASLAVLPQATLDLNETAGTVQVYVKNSFELAGKENQVGGDGHVLIAAFGCAPDVVAAPFRGTVSAQNAALSLVAPAGTTFAGRYFASSIQLGPNNSVAGLATVWPTSLPPPGTRPARLPPPLPAPPPPVVGCYVNTRNGWKTIPCATDAFIRANFPHPVAQLTVSSSATPKLVFGQIAVTVPQVASENNVFGSTTTANQWSVQETTNLWTVSPTATTGAGDTATVQFVIQSKGTTSGICIWNVDVTAQTYPAKCVDLSPHQRPGGLQAFDVANVAGTITANGTLTMVAQLSWVPSGEPNQYAVVSKDIYGLAANWTEVSGGLLGLGGGSQAQFTK